MPPDQLSLTFAALADPTRRSILTRLAEGEATVNQLAEPFAVSLPAISRHLKVLERAGLIVRSREAQWRPSRMQADHARQALDEGVLELLLTVGPDEQGEPGGGDERAPSWPSSGYSYAQLASKACCGSSPALAAMSSSTP